MEPTLAATTRRLARLPEWVVAVGATVTAVGMCLIPGWRGEHFYYAGDQHDQYFPMYHQFGGQLRAGNWPTMDPDGWLGGNYAAEGLTGIWNPVNLANFVLVSHFDDLSLAASVVMIEMLAVLALGVYLLAREYGSGRAPAFVFASAIPVSGFTLWYEAAGWPAGLMAFVWSTHFWWSARRHARGMLNPLVPFGFGVLAMTTGNPYGALALVIVLAGLAVELLLIRRLDRLRHLVLMGACVGATALMVYLPLIGSGDVTFRKDFAGVRNDTFLVPDAGDLVASSSPTYLPSMTNWEGGVLEHVPSTYFAWFVLPLLPWLRWGELRARCRGAAGLFVVAGCYLAASLGPSNLWLFRWPVRVVEYLYLAVAVLVALALSAGLATDRGRDRLLASAAIAGGGTYLAWAVQPGDLTAEHLAGFVLVVLFTAAAGEAYRRCGTVGLASTVLVGTACVLTLQTSAFPRDDGDSAIPAHDISALRAQGEPYRGTILQLASMTTSTPEELRDGTVMFGNLPKAADLVTVVSYTGMGFEEFGDALCMDHRGSTCPEAFDRLWQPVGAGIGVPLIDGLRVSTLVLQRGLLRDVVDSRPPAGWHAASVDATRAVWVRDRPYDGSGRVSWTSPAVHVTSDRSQPQRESVRYSASAPGRMLFARLAWPGYSATVDGWRVDVDDGPVGLVTVDVPAGTHTVVLEYNSPGLRGGVVAAVVAGVIAVAHGVAWVFRGRRRSGDDARAVASGSRR